MTAQERRAWTIVASLFVTLFLLFGSGYNTAGVFFSPLLKEFGWSRARLSLLTTVLALSAGAVTPLIGWMLDRVEARVMIVAGAALSAGGFVLASRAETFPMMIAAYLMLGTGIGAATLLPCSLVVANWFTGAGRGLALGLTMAGTSVGGMIMTLVASKVIGATGWRNGYLVLAVPMVLVVIPLAILMVRTRPQNDSTMSVAEAADALPGYEVAEALRVRSFWLIAAVQLLFAFAAAGTNLHAIPHLIGAGYSAAVSATIVGVVLGLAGMGKLVMGLFADRIGGRQALSLSLLFTALGLLMLIGAGNRSSTTGFIIFYGFTVGVPLSLVPMVMAESLGLKRFGSLAGLTGLLNTIGGAMGPVFAGKIFDVNGSYTTAFEIFAVGLVLASAATFACAPFKAAEAPARPLAATA